MSSLQVLSTFRRYAIQRLLESSSSEGLIPLTIQGLLRVLPPSAWELPHVLFVNPCRFTSNLWIEILLRQCIIGRDRLPDSEDLVTQAAQQDFKKGTGSGLGSGDAQTIEFYSHPNFIDLNVHHAFQDDLSVVCAFLKTVLDTRHVTGQRRVVILRDVGEMHGQLGHLALAHMLDRQEALVWMTCASSSHIHPKLLSRCMIVRTHATWSYPRGEATLVHDFLAECMGLDAEHDPRVQALIQSVCTCGSGLESASQYPDVVKLCIQLEVTQDPAFAKRHARDPEDESDDASLCPDPAPEPAWIAYLRATLDKLCEKAKTDRKRGNARANPVKSHHYHEVRDLVGILVKNAIPFPMIAKAILDIYPADASVAAMCAETDALLAMSSQKDLFALERFFVQWIDGHIRS